MGFNYKDVEDAYERIKNYIRKTPLEESYYLGDGNRKYFFKLESFQRAKSFKIRGALNKMMTLSEEEKARVIATVSSGNHGSSVSYAASILGIKNANVIVPKSTPQSKIDKIKYFGANVMLMGQNYDEAYSLGMAYIKENGMTFIDAYYSDPLIYAGHGTITIEILEQNEDIDTIIVPIGGGGLITGIAVVAKAVSFMAKDEKYIVEAGSCTTVAAVTEHRERIGGKNIALVLSGGNIDGKLLTSILEKY